jgi:transposase
MTGARDAGAGARWISGATFAYLEAWAPRVSCREHGVIVAAVPRARHESSFTRAFEDHVAWLAVHTNKSAVAELMRIAWRTVGWICDRVMSEQLAGRDKQTAGRFLDLLGVGRCKQLLLASCDMPSWITIPLAERCPNATGCYDPFHLVKLATDALDDIRREVWNEARRAGQRQLAAELKGARFALWKNPDNLTEQQQLKLARIQQLNQRLYRTYLLCQQLRQIYRVGFDQAFVLLDVWLK